MKGYRMPKLGIGLALISFQSIGLLSLLISLISARSAVANPSSTPITIEQVLTQTQELEEEMKTEFTKYATREEFEAVKKNRKSSSRN